MNTNHKKSLLLSILDGCCYSFMVGLAETYFSAYLLSKGSSEVAAGLISTIPILAGGILQLYSPAALYYLKSYKKLVTKTAAVQGVSLFLLAGTAFFEVPIYLIFLIIALYWAGGMSTGPAWNSWMASIVPEHLKLKFFAHRAMLSTFCIFLGIAIGGLILHNNSGEGLLKTFYGMFIGAGLLRLLSAFFLSQQIEPKEITKNIHEQKFKYVGQKKYTSLFRFIFIFQFGVHLSATYFNPFMLKVLNLSFRSYMILLALMLLAKVASQPITRKIIELIGMQRTLMIATLGIIPLPLVWALTDNYFILAMGQIASGLVWGMYEFTIFMTLYEQIPVKERPSALSQMNFYQTISIVAGSILGGVIFKFFESNITGYMIVFYVSTVGRFLSLAFFPSLNFKAYKFKDLLLLKPFGDHLLRGDLTQQPIENKDVNKETHLKKSEAS